MRLPHDVRRLWAELVRVGPHADAHWVALRAGLSLGAPLVLLWGLDRLDLALAASFGAFTALYARTHGRGSRTAMQASAAVVLVAAVGLGTAIGTSPHRAWLAVAGTVVVAAVAQVASSACAWHPPGPLFPVFAVGATSAHATTARDVGLALAASTASAAFAMLVARLGLLHGPSPHVPWSVDARAALARPGTRADAALAAVAVGAAGAAATGAGLGHAYWAAVGAAAATSGPSASARVVRAAQRAVGTVGGVGVAAALLALDPSAGTTIVLAVVLQVLAELLVGRNYALALLVVTPLALLMVHLAVPATTGRLVADRVVDTVLGVAIGTLLVLATGARRRRTR